MQALLKDKRAGRATEPEPAPAEPTTVIDLTEALRNSIHKRDVDDLSKADLTRLARRLKISGRSTMSRTELAQAVRKAQKSVRKAS